MKRSIFWICVGGFLAATAEGREVIDLGSLKVEGAARGPDIRLIDTARLDDATAEGLALGELSNIEKRLLGLPTPNEADARALPRRKEAKR
jgi:hypothetical protein